MQFRNFYSTGAPKISHSPEPWTVEKLGREGKYGCLHSAGNYISSGDTYEAITLENAERIAACVNFCRAFSTAFLTRHETIYLTPGVELTTDSSVANADGWIVAKPIPIRELPASPASPAKE